MEAKELMIGDWVINKDEPTKVNYLNGVKIGTENEYFIEYCECCPIPLTEEMLKANGFDKEGLTYEFYDGYNFFLEGKKGVCVHVGPIWCVHELQHALRLCGLNDLADNFKIE